MRPETWLPTCTVFSGETTPVAVTRATMRPRSTTCVSCFGAGAVLPRPNCVQASTATMASTGIDDHFTMRFMASSSSLLSWFG